MGHCCQLFSDVPACLNRIMQWQLCWRWLLITLFNHSEWHRWHWDAVTPKMLCLVSSVVTSFKWWFNGIQNLLFLHSYTRCSPRFSIWHIFIFFTFVSLSWCHLSTSTAMLMTFRFQHWLNHHFYQLPWCIYLGHLVLDELWLPEIWLLCDD